MRLLLIGLIIVLSGCEIFKVKPNTVTTVVPVVQPCLTHRPVTPAMRFDTLPKAKNEVESAQQVRVLWDDRQTLLNTILEWQTAASGCQVLK